VVDCAKTAERIDILFGMKTPGDPKSTELDEVSISHGEGRGRGFDAAFAKLLWPLTEDCLLLWVPSSL